MNSLIKFVDGIPEAVYTVLKVIIFILLYLFVLLPLLFVIHTLEKERHASTDLTGSPDGSNIRVGSKL